MARFRTAGACDPARVGLIPLLGCMLVTLAAVGCSPAKPVLHRVTIQGFRFDPEVVQVAPGDTVEWTNGDVVPHTSTGTRGTWDSSTIAAGASWRWVVAAGTTGTDPYTCRFHPTMKGSLVVR